MSTPFDDVRHWSEKTDCSPHFDSPNALNAFIVKLLAEEYEEFTDAIVKGDEVKQLDGAVDMMWVIIRYMISKGWDVEGAWEELTRSNNSKILPNGQVIRNEQGKIQKPDCYVPPNFKPYLRKEMEDER